MVSAVRVLVVEDEQGIREVLRQYLAAEGHVVIEAEDGHVGLATFRQQAPDFVLLDLMLPGIDGFSLVTEFRRLRPQVPVIMLTARDQEIDKIAGLRLGADDYVTKPFSPRELMARIAAVTRRLTTTTSTPPDGIDDGPETAPARGDGLWLHLLDRRAFYFGQELALTRSELTLISALGARPMRTFTRSELIERLRGDDGDVTERSVDVHVANLRRKLDEAISAAGQSAINPVETVWGLGYRWREEVPAVVVSV